MGEEIPLFRAEFNHSLRIESRPERLTSEPGAIVLREVLERLGLMPWLEERLLDPRHPALITHPLSELVRTSLLLLAQGWHDQDDADALREDSVFRLAVSDRRGLSPLEAQPLLPQGLASQPTLSRLVRALALERNRQVLRQALVELASRRVRALRQGHRLRYLTLDVDSFPIVVHGHQIGSEHNGHYDARIFHPLIATAAELGDLFDVRLRPGNAYTADGALDFILPLLDTVERKLCQVAAVRLDAGFPEEELLSILEKRGTPYVARVRNNSTLNRWAEPYLKRPVGRPPTEPRVWTYEKTYQAQSWSRPRRCVLVVLERPEELFLHHFWLITSWTREAMPAGALLEHYRERGTAENYIGELVNVLHPTLSSVSRPKRHYQGKTPRRRYPAANSYFINEALLLVNALAYNVAHTARILMELASGEGWSLQRFRDRVLRVAGRVLLHGRRATLILGSVAAHHWRPLLAQLGKLRWAGS